MIHFFIFTGIPDGKGSNTTASCCKRTYQYAVGNRRVSPTSRYNFHFVCVIFSNTPHLWARSRMLFHYLKKQKNCVSLYKIQKREKIISYKATFSPFIEGIRRYNKLKAENIT
jgi:predicted amidophosphoribosyltransferase